MSLSKNAQPTQPETMIEQEKRRIRKEVCRHFGLKGGQVRAVLQRNKPVAVTAGAGSGKTRTLTARYLSLLGEGYLPEQIVAITFTEKAAREMRNRARSGLQEMLAQASSPEERQRWQRAYERMDAARIGTIHGLCAQALRSLPAQAGLDPGFRVLDEAQAKILQGRVAEEMVHWAAAQPALAPLFEGMKADSLQTLRKELLAQRLDARAAFDADRDPDQILQAALEPFFTNPEVRACMDELQAEHDSGALSKRVTQKQFDNLETMLDQWTQGSRAFDDHDPIKAALSVFRISRLNGLSPNIKDDQAEGWVRVMREASDRWLVPIMGGENSTDPPPNIDVESIFRAALPAFKTLFETALQTYEAELARIPALDFDGLEEQMLNLMRDPDRVRHWVDSIRAVLVDEFQDTNGRQGQIVEALCGTDPGKLFLVGDARQSIYRFRGADVTVFKAIRKEIQKKGGRVLDLEVNYRSHPGVLATFDALLAKAMSIETSPPPPDFVPYSPLKPDPATIKPIHPRHPYLEFVIAPAQNAKAGRQRAAAALVRHLQALKRHGLIEAWDEVALLFRTARSFPEYEFALHEAGIPYMAIAGSGFYDRPEIRDFLNILRSAADPSNDPAWIGVLQSPVFGLNANDVFQLYQKISGKRPLQYQMWKHLDEIEEPARGAVRRALDLVREIGQMANRLPVSDLLHRIAARTDYRAILAARNTRLERNMDKLLADVTASGIIGVQEYLEYLDAMREVEAREGEAPADAEGMVRLMTIHKSKGLEFKTVVLADASRTKPGREKPVLISQDLGAAFKLDCEEADPIVYRTAKHRQNLSDKAEAARVLYVALTRAEARVIINGYLTERHRSDQFLSKLLTAIGEDPKQVTAQPGPKKIKPDAPVSINIWVTREDHEADAAIQPANKKTDQNGDQKNPFQWLVSDDIWLYTPITEETANSQPTIKESPQKKWAIEGGKEPPAAIVGTLVHRAIQRWIFPGNPLLQPLMESAALKEGLVHPQLKEKAFERAVQLLSRFKEHPFWQELDAVERLQEIPYIAEGAASERVIDLLYCKDGKWTIVDFKTDKLDTNTSPNPRQKEYRQQVEAYCQAAAAFLGQTPKKCICYLDDGEMVRIESW